MTISTRLQCIFTLCKSSKKGSFRYFVRVEKKGWLVSLTDNLCTSPSQQLLTTWNNRCVCGVFVHQNHERRSQHTTKRTFSTSTGRKPADYYYKVLELKPNATQEQIKSAYYEMSKLYHPDVSKKPEAHEKFTEITLAYEVLRDLKKRRMYDIGLGGDLTSVNQSSDTGVDWDTTINEKNASFKKEAQKIDDFCKQHSNELRKRRIRERRIRERNHNHHMHTQTHASDRSSRTHPSDRRASFFLVIFCILCVVVGAGKSGKW